MGQVALAGHLARRFFGSLSRRPPAPADEAWALDALLPGERDLWVQMSNADRRHAIGVARRAVGALGPERATRPVRAAALLHDVGKISSGFGPFARAGATVWAGVRGRARVAAGDGRVARYLRHDSIGAALLADAGSEPLTVAWAAEHHWSRPDWTLPAHVADALKAADDD
jgi:Cas3, HD domain